MATRDDLPDLKVGPPTLPPHPGPLPQGEGAFLARVSVRVENGAASAGTRPAGAACRL
jgi:hypothetical protein